VLGGFIGRAREVGVPGQDGPGDPIVLLEDSLNWDRNPMSGGAGLFEDIRRPGRSIFWLKAIFTNSSRLSNVYVPSFVFNV
jgi:hypothetical protein